MTNMSKEKKVKSISLWYALWAVINGIVCGKLWFVSKTGESIVIGIIIFWIVLVTPLIAKIYYEHKEYE